MRTLVVTENITLDGVIDMSGGWFDPLNEDVDQTDITAANTEHIRASRVVQGPRDDGWENSTVLRGPVVDEVRALKGAPGLDIVATGSTQLVHALIAAGLVDEYRLFVFPVVVGHGARLFESAAVRLDLLETRPFVSGAVLLRYAAAGDPHSG